jgi:hypothetical protein
MSRLAVISVAGADALLVSSRQNLRQQHHYAAWLGAAVSYVISRGGLFMHPPGRNEFN